MEIDVVARIAQTYFTEPKSLIEAAGGGGGKNSFCYAILGLTSLLQVLGEKSCTWIPCLQIQLPALYSFFDLRSVSGHWMFQKFSYREFFQRTNWIPFCQCSIRNLTLASLSRLSTIKVDVFPLLEDLIPTVVFLHESNYWKSVPRFSN